MRTAFRWMIGSIFTIMILACSGEVGHRAAMLFPFLRSLRPELNYEPVECSEDYDEPTAGRACVMEVIECGDEIEASTADGSMRFSDDFYVESQFTPFGYNYGNSPEVVYQLDLPERKHARLTLISPCADLDIAAFRNYEDEDAVCPEPSQRHRESEMSLETTAVDRIDLETAQFSAGEQGETVSYFVIIDGKSDGDDGQAGNFRLEVECWDK